MAVPVIVNDGTGAYGLPNSGIITINSQAYNLENISIDRPEDEALQRNYRGVPARQRFTAGVATLTGDLQLDESTPYPKFGDTFTYTADSNYGSETWIVLNQSFEATNSESEYRTAPLRAKKAINPGSVSVVN